LGPTSALPLLPFCFKHFFLASSSSQVEEKKKNKEKNVGKGRSFPLKSHSALSPFGSHFCPLAFSLLFQTLSPNIFFFSSEKNKNVMKGRLTFKILLYLFIFCFYLWPPFLPFCFKHFFFNIFFFSSQKQKKKNAKKKKMQRRERAYFQALTLPSHFWLLFLASYFCHFISSTFSLAFASSQARKKTQKKKTIEKKKKCKEREGTYLFSLISAFGVKHSSCFLLSTFLQC